MNGASLVINSYEIVGVINDEELFRGKIKCHFDTSLHNYNYFITSLIIFKRKLMFKTKFQFTIFRIILSLLNWRNKFLYNTHFLNIPTATNKLLNISKLTRLHLDYLLMG